ncbi:MAG: hypothetical protein EOM20_17275 [Spartobacteria bacterium]|nr:hypothetical protein [Spartobacteria bacterium]
MLLSLDIRRFVVKISPRFCLRAELVGAYCADMEHKRIQSSVVFRTGVMVGLLFTVFSCRARESAARDGRIDLPAVLEAVAQTRASGETPVAVFDLDATLFDNSPRTRRLLEEAAQVDPTLTPYTEHIRKLPQQLPYRVDDSLTLAGITDRDARKRFKAYWSARFFTDDYCIYDIPIPGAVDLVNTLHDAGATIVYLTSRGEDRMKAGTIESLRQNGFPIMKSTAVLIMKPTIRGKDTTYKEIAAKNIKNIGKVLITAENESQNANIFAENWPEATHFYLNTTCNPKKIVPLHDSIIKIDDFSQK